MAGISKNCGNKKKGIVGLHQSLMEPDKAFNCIQGHRIGKEGSESHWRFIPLAIPLPPSDNHDIQIGNIWHEYITITILNFLMTISFNFLDTYLSLRGST